MKRMKGSIEYRVGRFVKQLFDEKLPSNLIFHNLDHTINVVRGVQIIGKQMNISGTEQEILNLAAWFHDTGHITRYRGHEEISQQIAFTWLRAAAYPRRKLDQVLSCIAATKLPQTPSNKLEEIVCDADLFHLSQSGYCETQAKLRAELELIFDKTYTNKEWALENMAFIEGHHYFTSYGRSVLEKQKSLNKIKCKEEWQQDQAAA